MGVGFIMRAGFFFGGGGGGVGGDVDGAGLFDEEGDGFADFGKRGGFLGSLGTPGSGWWTHVALVRDGLLEGTLPLAQSGFWWSRLALGLGVFLSVGFYSEGIFHRTIQEVEIILVFAVFDSSQESQLLRVFGDLADVLILK